ncbi:translocation/assembly module TamB domain-containing protein [Pseudidiomarina sp.]|uniref:translocation/assembly module TamB domain-containing protein n=1 Tax=Pseudidiomarina sp. TaxID=2081707 RepID=UPI003A979759
MRWLKRVATIVVALFIIIPLAAYLLISTNAGSRFVLSQAIKFAPVTVSYSELTGTLIDELVVEDLTVVTPTEQFRTDTLTLKWQPFDLLDKQLTIDKLSIERAKLQLADSQESNKQTIVLPTIELPFRVTIAQLVVQDFGLQTGADSNSLTNYQLLVKTEVRLVDTRLNLTNFSVQFDQPQFSLNHDGQLSLRLAGDYPIKLDGDYSLEFNDTRLPAVNGNVQLNGAVQNTPLKLQTTFKTPTTAAQQLTAEVASLLETPTWQADLILDELPLTLLHPWLTDYADLSEQYITPNSAMSGRVLIGPEKLKIPEVSISKLGDKNGSIAVAGEWQHNNFANDFRNSPFQLTLDYKNIGYHTDTLKVDVETGLSSVTGTLDAYQFDNRLTLAVNAPSQVRISELATNLSGAGSLQGVNISTLSLVSEELELAGQLEANWARTLDVNLEIESGRSTLGREGAEALLQGGLELKNNELMFRDFAVALNSTKLTLNGSTVADNLTGQLIVEDLQQLPYMPDGLSELQALETNFSIDTRAQLSEFNLIIQDVKLQTVSLDSWLLQAPTKLSIQRSDDTWLLDLNSLCLQHDANQFGLLCAQLNLGAESLVANLNGERLSLWLLNRFRERDVAQRIAGLVTLNASATLNRDTFKIRDVGMQLSSNNTVFFALNQETSTRLSYWELSARGNADAVTADLEGQLANNEGGLFGDLAILDLYNTREIEGSLLFALDDLAMLDWVLPGMRYHGGKATAQLNLTGTLNDPSLNGDMEVYAESVVFAETNFVFNDVRLALIDRPNSQGTLEIEGQAKAGNQGWLLVEGVAMPLDAEAYLRITGKNFRALQMPTATVDVSPDLTVHVNQRAIDIAGTVDIPYAAITAPDFETSVSNSNDVVITRDGEPVTEGPAQDDGLAVNAQIRVTLGQQVSVDAYGFTGRLQGSLEVVEEPRRPTTAIGSINVAEGSYELYGQELTIDRGAFIYNGGDISNPGLDLRVKRDIANGNSLRSVNVGAQVVGTLTEPDFRLYSTPAMPDSEILSYLILGKSMQSASSTSSDDIQLQALLMLGAKGTDAIGESLQDTFGIDEFGIDNDPNTRETSFYIGKYLSPKLFVRYGVGLLESTNTFMVRYQLTERLLIETMASSQAQGGDIFYTFER